MNQPYRNDAGGIPLFSDIQTPGRREKYSGKSLPVVVKNYKETRPKSVIIYVGQYFGIFPFLEFLQLYTECTLEVRRLPDPIRAKV